MRGLRRAALTAVLVACGSATPAAAQDGKTPIAEIPVADIVPEVWCTPGDPALGELSGLAMLGTRLFATPDAGPDERILELDSDCAVLQRIAPTVDPYDVEDLAAGPDGKLWLGDVGDNSHTRETIALISLDPDSGTGDLHRLTYPDGARDAETVLIGRTGEPVVVTKALFGSSSVYRPARGRTVTELASPGPTALEKAGSLSLGPTDTPGGPIPGASSTLVTGGAVDAGGTVVAIRTYTDVYLFHAPDGDLATALVEGPDFRIAVPGEPQGEAVVFTADGDLLTGSETGTSAAGSSAPAAASGRPPIQILRGVTDLFTPRNGNGAVDEDSSTAPSVLGGVAVGVAAAGLLVWLIRRAARRR